jgi:pyruvate/2-oxoacid:ferredoxin oxidoreductase alpha subunit
MQKMVLLGNEAIARGAYEADCRVAAAYPGTPSTDRMTVLLVRFFRGFRR